MDAAISELERLIAAQYPAASFAVSEGDDPMGVYLTVTVDLDDAEDIVPIFLERMLELQINEGLPLYVIPVESHERAAARRTTSMSRRGRARLPLAS